MIHENKEEFIKILERAVKKKGFLLPLMEKDYYLTLILSRANELSEDLILILDGRIRKSRACFYDKLQKTGN